jgi:hypothetical protein
MTGTVFSDRKAAATLFSPGKRGFGREETAAGKFLPISIDGRKVVESGRGRRQRGAKGWRIKPKAGITLVRLGS